jgi:uncharacterized DUF497 family protein
VDGIRFEWDEAKNLANQREHGISFEAAIQVFADPLHFSIPERIVNGEVRWQRHSGKPCAVRSSSYAS